MLASSPTPSRVLQRASFHGFRSFRSRAGPSAPQPQARATPEQRLRERMLQRQQRFEQQQLEERRMLQQERLRQERSSDLPRPLARHRAALELAAAIPLPRDWQREGWCFYKCPDNVRPSNKIAAFDFDKTLHFGGSAWWLSCAHVPGALQWLHSQGYKIVVFSNQHGPSRERTRESMEKALLPMLDRFDAFAEFCGCPMQLFIAASRADVDDPFRKPNGGMWHLAASEKCNGGIVPEVSQSFYCGNAAGRPSDGNRADREFAENVGLEFWTEDKLHNLGIQVMRDHHR